MPLDFIFELGEEGITIPYEPFVRETRTNHGFMDLRGNVNAASLVAEAVSSPALVSLIARCAGAASPIFTAGCDLGSHVEETQPIETRQVAGGYFHLVPARFDLISHDDWSRLSSKLEDGLEYAVCDDTWIVRVELESMQINLDDFNSLGVAIRIVFYALSQSQPEALASRERLILAIDGSLNAKAILECWDESLSFEQAGE